MRCDWLASHIESRINELLTLGPGWDGYHANLITIDAVGTVVDVLAHLSTDLVVPPLVFPLPDGGMQVEWHAGREAVEIEVDAEGDAHLLVTDETGAIVMNTELPPDDSAGFAAARRAVERLSARLLRADLSVAGRLKHPGRTTRKAVPGRRRRLSPTVGRQPGHVNALMSAEA
jgi:hypothetical protein